jgi:hypothetical protein
VLFQNLKAIGEELLEIYALFCKYIYIFIYIDMSARELLYVGVWALETRQTICACIKYQIKKPQKSKRNIYVYVFVFMCMYMSKYKRIWQQNPGSYCCIMYREMEK